METEEEEDDDDKEVVLLTKMVKTFLNNKRNSGSSSGPGRDLSDYTFYNCQQKGHLSRNCTNSKVEQPEKKPEKQALLTTSAWGDKYDDEVIYGGFRGICLMAAEQDTEVSTKLPSKFHEKIYMLDKPDLLNMILGIIDDSTQLHTDNDRLESELNDLHAECVDLSNRIAEKEKALAKAKEIGMGALVDAWMGAFPLQPIQSLVNKVVSLA